MPEEPAQTPGGLPRLIPAPWKSGPPRSFCGYARSPKQHKIVNEAIRAQEPGDDQMDSKDTISKADREKLKLASRSLLSALRVHIQPMPNWTKNTLTQADVKMFILDDLYTSLPRPPFSDAETDSLASRVYDFVWQRSAAGAMFVGAT